MSDNIFANAPVWTPTKVTDTSNILDSLAKAYDKQKEAYDSMVTGHDKFWKTAQKQHQQDAVQALNNMSVDQLTAVDENGITAKQKYINELEQASKAIGGYSNMVELDSLFDSRINNAIADENTMRVRDEAVRQDKITNLAAQLNPLITMSNNSNQMFSTADQQRATDELTKLVAGTNAQERPHEYNYIVEALNDAGLSRVTDAAAYLNASSTHAEADYKANHAALFEPHLHSIAKATALLNVAESMGDKDLVKKLQEQLSVLESVESVADEKTGTKDGFLTSYLRKMSPNTLKYFNANRDAMTQKLIESYGKDFRANSQLDLAMRKHMLQEASVALEEYIAKNGSWYQREQIRTTDDTNTIRAATATANMVGGSNSSGGGDKKSAAKLSFSGNPTIEEWYGKELKISNPIVLNDKGEYVLNTSSINQGINTRLNEIQNPNFSDKLKEIEGNVFANESRWWERKSRIKNYKDDLNNFKYRQKDDRGVVIDSRPLTQSEKDELLYYAVSSQGGMEGYVWGLSEDAINEKIASIEARKLRESREFLATALNYMTQDFKTVDTHKIVADLGWLDNSNISKYLDSELINKAKSASNMQKGKTPSARYQSPDEIKSVGNALGYTPKPTNTKTPSGRNIPKGV